MGITISPVMMVFLVFMTGFAGFVDSAAGGGGLISLPAYLFAGLPPHYTYATNKFSAACGTTFAHGQLLQKWCHERQGGHSGGHRQLLRAARWGRTSSCCSAMRC